MVKLQTCLFGFSKRKNSTTDGGNRQAGIVPSFF
jgi:hypothetical protein